MYGEYREEVEGPKTHGAMELQEYLPCAAV